jgi:hypothetical protein
LETLSFNAIFYFKQGYKDDNQRQRARAIPLVRTLRTLRTFTKGKERKGKEKKRKEKKGKERKRKEKKILRITERK